MTIHIKGQLLESTDMRTHAPRALLALLALHQGRPMEREQLAEKIWPDSSLDKARYNLRRALTDFYRAPKIKETKATEAIVKAGSTLYLHPELAWVDVTEFDRIQQGPMEVEALTRLMQLYSAPLLDGCKENWLFVSAHREIRRNQCRATLNNGVRHLVQQEVFHEAIPLLRHLLFLDPLDESVVRSLMTALIRQGSLTEAEQVYSDLSDRLRQDKQIPTPDTREIHKALLGLRSVPLTRPVIATPQLPPQAPGGAIRIHSPYYIQRPTDEKFQRAIRWKDGFILIKGPRQTGKSNLLARGCDFAKQCGYAVVETNLEAIPEENFVSLNTLAFFLATSLAEQLEREPGPWDHACTPTKALANLEEWVCEVLSQDSDLRIFWALDGIDALFAQPYRDDFFKRLRFWQGLQADGPMEQLTIILVHSTEAQHFITDMNNSPFNLGKRLELTDFSDAELDIFHQRYNSPLRRASDRERFWRLVGGHPYLNDRGLYALAVEDYSLENLEASANLARSSPFHTHLTQLDEGLSKKPALMEGIHLFLQGKVKNLSDKDFYRLVSVGLLIGEDQAHARCRCGLYEDFLRRKLGL